MRDVMTIVVIGISVFAVSGSRAQGEQPGRALNEAQLTQLLELQIDDDAIVAKITKSGIAYTVDDEAVERLKRAGASETVLKAVRLAAAKGKGDKPPRTSAPAISYDDLVKLLKSGIEEAAIAKRFQKAPTVFVFDQDQLAELKSLGASEALLVMLQGLKRAESTQEISNVAVILDCSKSMEERTADGSTKVQVAKQVVTDLINRLPEGLAVSILVYGHIPGKLCGVEVVHPLAELTPKAKEELGRALAALPTAGNTPIAASLTEAGSVLDAGSGNGGILLITDGVETCKGDPTGVAAQLAENPRLSFGVNVVGFGLKPEEQTKVQAIADAGHGKYYNADSAEEFADAISTMRERITAQAASPKQREARHVVLAGADAKPGAFFGDAPAVASGEFKGKLPFMGAHYYLVPLRQGQPLRAVVQVKKSAYEARDAFSKIVVNQTFSVTIYNQQLQPVAREAKTVEGNPTDLQSFRAQWTADADGVAFIAVAASDNHSPNDDHSPIRLADKKDHLADYVLRIRYEGEPGDSPPAPLQVVEPGSGFGDAGQIKIPGMANTDLKLGEVLFYGCDVKEGEQLRVAVAVQKPWYEARNNFSSYDIRATYTLTIFDDDQVEVAKRELKVKNNPPDAQALELIWPVSLTGRAYLTITCQNSGGKLTDKSANPAPGRLSIQVTK